MIVAILALVVSLAGTSFAALHLGKNAVKTKNIKNGAVTSAKIADSAITTGKIADRAVTSGKLAPGAITGGNIAPSAKSNWVQTAVGGFSIVHASGGVTVAPIAAGIAVVDFGVDMQRPGDLRDARDRWARCLDSGQFCPLRRCRVWGRLREQPAGNRSPYLHREPAGPHERGLRGERDALTGQRSGKRWRPAEVAALDESKAVTPTARRLRGP
jgi:hypothetical protein